MDVDAPNAGFAEIVAKVDARIRDVNKQLQQLEAHMQLLEAKTKQLEAARRLAQVSVDHPNCEAVRQAAGDYADDNQHFLQIELGRIRDYLISRRDCHKSRIDYMVQLQKEKNLLIYRRNEEFVHKQLDFERFQRFDQRLFRRNDYSTLNNAWKKGNCSLCGTEENLQATRIIQLHDVRPHGHMDEFFEMDARLTDWKNLSKWRRAFEVWEALNLIWLCKTHHADFNQHKFCLVIDLYHRVKFGSLDPSLTEDVRKANERIDQAGKDPLPYVSRRAIHFRLNKIRAKCALVPNDEQMCSLDANIALSENLSEKSSEASFTD